MQTIANRKHFALFTLAVILIVPLLGTSTASAQNGSTGTVSDAAPNMVRSDGGGSYINGVDCVSVAMTNGGFWQLRTVAHECHNSETTPRYLTLDFGTSPPSPPPPGDLDGDGFPEQVEFAPARFIFNEAFKKNATTTPVHIYVLTVNPNGSTTQDTAWAIEYRYRATITINGDGSRTLALTGAAAAADVYSVTRLRNREQRQFVGTYELPFSVLAK